MNFERLQQFLKNNNKPAFRINQVMQAYFIDLLSSWESLTVFSKSLREECASIFQWDELKLQKKEDGGDTTKYLFITSDGHRIEAVLMRHKDDRRTACVSSQIGCPMACAFCATGAMGFTRNLSVEEIVNQIVWIARDLKKKKERISNVVYMGMGEPFHNYDNVLTSIRMLNNPRGLNIGARRISISTCGIIPGILRFAEESLQVNLAISLHAAIDTVRSSIMPVNSVYPLKKLMEAVAIYMEKTNRRVMFEYVMLSGLNDREEDALALAKLLRPYIHLSFVNLIRYNLTGVFASTELEQEEMFLARLHELHIPATLRANYGEGISAACGQLATKKRK